jgi:acetylglutamate kinase
MNTELNAITGNEGESGALDDFESETLLAEATRFAGRNIVVKYGGAAMSNGELKRAVMRDAVRLSRLGVRLTLVHGGGPEINAMLGKIGKEAVFVDGLRRTDAETLDIVCMVLAGKLNKELVGLLYAAGGRPVGLCGADGATLLAEKQRGTPDLGFVGEVRQTDAALLETLLSEGFTPVVATIGVDESGALLNVNADIAAAAIAVALRAEKLIFMTDVKGVMDGDSLIEAIRAVETKELIARGTVSGGMIPKVECCASAVESGLGEARIVDGRVPRALLYALSESGAVGTRFIK